MVCLRDEFGQWDPKNQRPELWNLFNPQAPPRRARARLPAVATGPSSTSGATSSARTSSCPALYYAHEREVFERDGMLLAVGPVSQPRDGETVETRRVRYRTVGDMSCTGRGRERRGTVADVVIEVAASTLTERGATRADDRISEAAMEDRKKEGYF